MPNLIIIPICQHSCREVYSILIEKINDGSLPEGYYYAHIPALDLTTHGFGIKYAKKAAQDLVNLWIEEKLANSSEGQFKIECGMTKAQ